MAALDLFQSRTFDLVLLDIMLPKIDGFGVCEVIRRQSQVPILMLTALDGEEQQLKGFGLNIDDYVTKPFSIPVLLEKIRVILRRSAGAEAENLLRYRDITVNLDTREVSLEGRFLDLTAGSLICCTPFWRRRAGYLPGRCCWPSCGAMIFTGTPGWWTATLKISAANWSGDYIETVRGGGIPCCEGN